MHPRTKEALQNYEEWIRTLCKILRSYPSSQLDLQIPTPLGPLTFDGKQFLVNGKRYEDHRTLNRLDLYPYMLQLFDLCRNSEEKVQRMYEDATQAIEHYLASIEEQDAE